MSIFKLQKWFFDVLLHQDTYLYLYFTKINFLGLSLSRFNLHYCSGSKSKSISQSVKLESSNTLSFQGASEVFNDSTKKFTLRHRLKNTDLALNYTKNTNPIFQSDSQSIKKKKGNIDWLPILLKSQVKGHVKLNNLYIPVNNNNGYIDYIHTDICPVHNPVCELYWGRLHSNELDLSFSIVFVKGEDKYYSTCICRLYNETFQTNQCNITIIQKEWSDKLNLTYPKHFSIKIKFPTFDLILNIEQKRILIESGFMDEQKSMNRIFIQFLKWISKNPRGLKFLSKGEVEIIQSNTIKIIGSNLISEYVRFGSD